MLQNRFRILQFFVFFIFVVAHGQITISIATVDVACFGDKDGEANATITGGTTPYTYAWSTTNGSGLVVAAQNQTTLSAGNYTLIVTDTSTPKLTANKSITITQPSQISAVAIQTSPVKCRGELNGEAEVTVTGGTPPYSFAWDKSSSSSAIATDLAAGTHTITITDANICIKTATVIISQPTAILSATVAQNSPVKCKGGSDGVATITAQGGTIPYTYTWDSNAPTNEATITNLDAGPHTVIVTDANGCEISPILFVITEPQFDLVASASQVSPATCFGEPNGKAIVTVLGGKLPYSYSWDKSTSITKNPTDLPAGINTVTVIDANDCETTAEVTILEPPVLKATTTQDSLVKCNGEKNGGATVTVTGGTFPYKYVWDKSNSTTKVAIDLAAGNHKITITDANDCETIAFVTIQEPPILSATAVQVNPVKCKGAFNGEADVTVAGGTAPYTFSWDKSNSTLATANDLAPGLHTITIFDANNCKTTAKVDIFEPQAALTASVVQITPVKCKGEANGVATVTATGGTPPYTYSWNNGSPINSATISNLTAGNHTVTVVDANNCQIDVFVTITEPLNALAAVVVQDNPVSCFNGTDGKATIYVTGGTASYTFLWDKSNSTTEIASDLKAGLHNITITDAKGCIITANVIIDEPIVLSATATQFSPVKCSGDASGSAAVIATGGTLPYSYSWSNSTSKNAIATDLKAGVNFVTVTDGNGCETKTSVLITEPNPILAIINEDSPVTCFGGSDGVATVTVSGGTLPYTYLWGNSLSTTATATDLKAGSHSITIRDANGCQTTATIIIKESPVILITAAQTSPVKCKGAVDGAAKVTVTGGKSPYTYFWDKSSSTSATASDLAAGLHTITIIDANGCIKTTTVTITEPNAILSATAVEDNPVKCKGAFNGKATVTVFGGTIPYTFSWDKSTSTSAIANDLDAGLHTITIIDANGCEIKATVTITDLYTLSASVVQLQAVSCNGKLDGSAIATGTGGLKPYTYSWDKSASKTATATGLGAGTHTVTITDFNGCKAIATVEIQQPDAMVATAFEVSAVKCKGAKNGSATVSVAGGTSPYTYAWENSIASTATATDLAAGMHTITITDAKGCSTSTSINITEPNALVVIGTVQPISCNKGGEITVNVTGGISTNYFYTWSGPSSFSSAGFGLKSITNLLNAGTYKLTVADDNGCQIIKFFTLNAYDALKFTGNTAIVFDTCDDTPTYEISIGDIRGGLPFYDLNGNPYYNYEWFGPNNYRSNLSVIPIQQGLYTLIIKDSKNCASNPISFTVTTPYEPIEVSEVIGNVSCDAQNNDGYISIAVNGGKTPYKILWEREIPSNNSGNTNPTYVVVGQDILRINNLMEGRYRLTVTSNLFSCADTNPAYKFQTIYTVATQNSIRILENPVLDDKLCTGNSGTLTVKVIDENDGPVSFYYNGLVASAENLGNSNYLVYIDNPVVDGILNIVNEVGCGETVVINISVVEPSFDISSVGYNLDGIVNLNEAVTFINTTTEDFFRLEWNFGDDSPIDKTDQPKHAYDVSGIYDATLRLYNEFDCYKEITLQIKVGSGSSVRFPDIFTPNRDGINDYFESVMIGIARFDFEIYDLWNNLIYTYNHASGPVPNNWGWDGNLPNGNAFTGKIFKYVFIGYDYSDEQVTINNQALLLR